MLLGLISTNVHYVLNIFQISINGNMQVQKQDLTIPGNELIINVIEDIPGNPIIISNLLMGVCCQPESKYNYEYYYWTFSRYNLNYVK